MSKTNINSDKVSFNGKDSTILQYKGSNRLTLNNDTIVMDGDLTLKSSINMITDDHNTNVGYNAGNAEITNDYNTVIEKPLSVAGTGLENLQTSSSLTFDGKYSISVSNDSNIIKVHAYDNDNNTLRYVTEDATTAGVKYQVYNYEAGFLLGKYMFVVCGLNGLHQYFFNPTTQTIGDKTTITATTTYCMDMMDDICLIYGQLGYYRGVKLLGTGLFSVLVADTFYAQWGSAAIRDIKVNKGNIHREFAFVSDSTSNYYGLIRDVTADYKELTEEYALFTNANIYSSYCCEIMDNDVVCSVNGGSEVKKIVVNKIVRDPDESLLTTVTPSERTIEGVLTEIGATTNHSAISMKKWDDENLLVADLESRLTYYKFNETLDANGVRTLEKMHVYQIPDGVGWIYDMYLSIIDNKRMFCSDLSGTLHTVDRVVHNYNTCIGYQAGDTMNTSKNINNVCIGVNADIDTDIRDCVTIGSNVVGSVSGSLFLKHRKSTAGAAASWNGDELVDGTSSRRYKQNIETYKELNDDRFNTIKVVSYQPKTLNSWNPKHPENENVLGMIAEELVDVYPHAVIMKDVPGLGVVEDSINYETLVPVLIDKVQQLIKRIDVLEGKDRVDECENVCDWSDEKAKRIRIIKETPPPVPAPPMSPVTPPVEHSETHYTGAMSPVTDNDDDEENKLRVASLKNDKLIQEIEKEIEQMKTEPKSESESDHEVVDLDALGMSRTASGRIVKKKTKTKLIIKKK